ncbi:hypothetical protein QFC19_001987 [Naganishia cerealis]|uniref:Uncharacterized protein n=1 Tax=Naganishia cerealis TaxID=610337 RepID=A0ACC2WGU1_9TREE|nr:hypothetical protein QFC19_001987 [Naganishia cerealis]
MESVTVTEATTSIEPIPSYRPDQKTRRYDRQLRHAPKKALGIGGAEKSRASKDPFDRTRCDRLPKPEKPRLTW